MLLEGKKMIVTGGITRYGKVSAIECAREGGSVVTMSRTLPTDDKAMKVIEECKKVGSGSYKAAILKFLHQNQKTFIACSCMML